MVPILMYHQVGTAGPATYANYTVTPVVFARQMRLLAALGYRAISLDDLLHAHLARVPAPKRSVVITFDDGYEDAIRNVVPVLARHRFTATFFVVAGLLGRTSVWTRRTRGVEMKLADSTAVRELADSGFTVGSHTLTHPRLAEIDGHECGHELRESKRRLEDIIGRDVRHLAYPFGSTNAAVRHAAAECGYRTACATIPGISSESDDLLMLRRINVRGNDSLADFACRLRTGRGVKDSLYAFRRVTMKVSDFAR